MGGGLSFLPKIHRKMVRHNLYITIPSYFKCPISLEVMKSPVSLCTGVTYDRTSIQKWLDGGNNICPATMQPLPTTDFVPNLTLHRLIHLWSVSQPLSQSPRSPHTPNNHHLLRSLICRVSNSDLNTTGNDDLLNILGLAVKSEENMRLLCASDRFLQSILSLLCKFEFLVGCDTRIVESAVKLLDLILTDFMDGNERVRQLNCRTDFKFLRSIVFVLRGGSISSKIAAAKVLEKIATDSKTQRTIAETQDLLHLLICNLVASKANDDSIEAGLSTLISLATSRSVKTELVLLGTVRTVGDILSQGSNPSAGGIIQKSMKMLELLATCGEGRKAIGNDHICLEGIVTRLMKMPEGATEHGVTVLWSVCYFFRDAKATEVVVRSNGLTKCLLLLQTNCSPMVRQLCGDLVKVLRSNSKSYLTMSYDTKTTHIMPC